MDPVSFEDQQYSAVPRSRVAREPFSITGILTKRGLSPAAANITLVVLALLIVAFAVWFYRANMPHTLSPSQIKAQNPLDVAPFKGKTSAP